MKKPQNNYAFIDGQNLNLSVREQGWILDLEKFRVYLSEKYDVRQAFYFIGFVPGNQRLYNNLQKYGYIVVFKPTLQGAEGSTKGNVDAELVLHAMIEYPNYDRALIVTGDGDFHCLVDHLRKNNKLLNVMIPNRRSYSSLFRGFLAEVVFVDNLRSKLEYRKNAV